MSGLILEKHTNMTVSLFEERATTRGFRDSLISLTIWQRNSVCVSRFSILLGPTATEAAAEAGPGAKVG